MMCYYLNVQFQGQRVKGVLIGTVLPPPPSAAISVLKTLAVQTDYMCVYLPGSAVITKQTHYYYPFHPIFTRQKIVITHPRRVVSHPFY